MLSCQVALLLIAAVLPRFHDSIAGYYNIYDPDGSVVFAIESGPDVGEDWMMMDEKGNVDGRPPYPHVTTQQWVFSISDPPRGTHTTGTLTIGPENLGPIRYWIFKP